MDPIASVSALVAVVALAIAARAYVLLDQERNPRVVEAVKTPAQDLKKAYLEVLAAKVAALETKVADLPSLFSDEVKRVTNQANRAAQALSDLDRRMAPSGESDEELSDHPPEAEGVFPIDGSVGGDPGVPSVLTRLGGLATPDMMARYRAVIAARGR